MPGQRGGTVVAEEAENAAMRRELQEMRAAVAALTQQCRELAARTAVLEGGVGDAAAALPMATCASDDAAGKDGGQQQQQQGSELASESGYSLSASMWDVALVLGLSPVGCAGSWFAAALLLLNVAVQLVFIAIVQMGLTTAEFDIGKVRGFRDWRRQIAHATTFATNDRSLAARVCEDDPGLEVASSQRDAHARISQYLGDGFPVGIVMCALCLLMWFLTVLKECKALIDLVRAVLALPRAAATELKDKGDTAALRAISTPRRIFVLAVQACRLGVSLVLVVSGAQWLSYETDLGNLLLNAVALEFVLNVDELIFEALAPHALARLIERCAAEPLPLPAPAAWRGLDSRTLASFGVYEYISL